jgi:transposase
VNLDTSLLGYLDTTGGQNFLNTSRTVHEPGVKNTQTKNHKKFKINATGFQGVNCKSILQITPNTRSFEFAKIFINIRLENTINPEGKILLNKVLESPNLTDEEIISYFKRKRPNQRESIENLNNIYYDEKLSYDKAIGKNNRYLNKLNPKHGNKIEEEKKKRLEQNLKENNLEEILAKEKTIHIVLDNYTVHHAGIIKSITQILNINLIYLPKRTSELNPIEDVWRMIKEDVSREFIKSKEHLSELYTTLFYEKVDNPTLYKNWLKEFIIM